MNILVVDDELNIRKTVGIFLEGEGHYPVLVSNPDDALKEARKRAFDLAFVDLRLGTRSGLDLIPELLATSPWLKVVVITAYASIDTAVEAMKRGAVDYIPKPFTPAQIKLVLTKISDVRGLEQRISALESQLEEAQPAMELATSNPDLQRAVSMAKDAAASDVSVLLRGESGTGKSTLARMIHDWSPRRSRPLGVISCPALSAELLESELFGHVKGAFTGAVRDHTGRVAACDGGTLFLDEIGDLPLSLQPKLLRFLQDHEYERIGDNVTRHADLRVIAATSIDLESAVTAGRFRQELLYRLNVMEIVLPSLRERKDDISELARQFLTQFGKQSHKHLLGFADAALERLHAHTWPGNIRELRNVVERAAILCKSEWVGVEHLPATLTNASTEPTIGDPVPLTKIEELHIRQVLATVKSLEEAAKVLGIDTATLWRRRKEYGI
jgi:NtrC-family two-component system response regulator AlgB